MDKLKALWKKYITRELILYGICGVFTTLVNIGIFYLLHTYTAIPYLLSNIIAWTGAVLFAYVVNKFFVFQSKVMGGLPLLREFGLFIGARLVSLGIDELGMYLMIDLLLINVMVSKIAMNVLVIIANYVFSKLIIFKKSNPA